MVYKVYVKRWLDFVIALIASFIMAPLIFVFGLIVILTTKGPMFFFQERLGFKEKKFSIVKLRTMTDKDHRVTHQIYKGDPEVTKIGEIYRRLKIDEFPQLFSVLRGDMSLVGPRPCLPLVRDKFGKYGKKRFEVRPGLTSLAAVEGSIYLTWEEKGYYDAYYAENVSFWLDIKIMFKTVFVLLLGERRMFQNRK